MKKSLLALAAMSAFVGAAHAQSSVTVYGVLDVGFLSTNGTTGADNANGSSTAGSQTAATANGGKRITSAFNTGNLTTSRLGFRGVESLGGGLTASFVAEIGLTPTGNGFSGSTNMNSSPMGTGYVHNSAAIDNRQSYVGLASKGLGEARIGRQYTPVHEAVCATNVGSCNAVAGDMIYFGANSTATLTPTNGIGQAYQIRAANSLRIATENINGFQAVALVSVNNNQVDNSGNTSAATQNGQGATNYRMHGFAASFTGVKNLDIRLAYQLTSLNRDNAVIDTTATGVVLGSTMYQAAASSTQGIARLEQKDAYGNISYNFGVAKVHLQTIQLKVESAGVQTRKRNANQLAVSVPVNNTVSAWASYGQGKTQAAPTAREYNFSGYQAGALYNLSKRTNLYAIYGVAKQDAVTTGNKDYLDQQYAVGVRHSF